MAKPEPEIDNTIQYAKHPGFKFFVFAILFFITGVLAIIKFDSYFTDFWKIRKCAPEGYARGDFMYGCGGIKVDRYHFGSIYLDVQKDASNQARNADVLIFGNSRTFRSFSTEAIDAYFKSKGLSYMVLAVEGASSRSALYTIEALNLKPKIVMINSEIFHSDKVGAAFRDLIDFPDKYKTRYQFFHMAQTLQKKVCATKASPLKSFYCSGKTKAVWRSAETGRITWDLIGKPEKQVLITDVPNRKTAQVSLFMPNANTMLNHPNLKKSCPILYLVNSPVSAPILMKNMAEDLGVQSAYTFVDDLYSYDKSHLDRPNSEKWATEFVKVLDPAIDYCLAGNTRSKPNELDLSQYNIAGVSDFETWRHVAQASVIDNGAQAPDNTQTADIIKIGKRGSKVQKLLRDQPIKKGSTLSFGVWLWSNEYSKARIQIVRSCSADTPVESTGELLPLSPRPKRFEITHTFKYDHKCPLVQIVGIDPDTQIYAWKSDIRYTEPDHTGQPEEE